MLADAAATTGKLREELPNLRKLTSGIDVTETEEETAIVEVTGAHLAIFQGTIAMTVEDLQVADTAEEDKEVEGLRTA